NAVKANVGVEFIGNELSAINLTLQDMASVELQVKEFEAITIADGEYYNLTSKHLGYAEVTYVDGEDEITVAVDVALGMGENVYLKLSSMVMGEVVEVVVLNGSAYVTVGDITLGVELTNIDGLIAEVMEILEMTKPASVAAVEEEKQEALTLKALGELLKSIDLTSFNFKDVDGLAWTIKNGESLAVTFEEENISVALTLFDDKSFNEVAPTVNATVKDVLEKMSNVKGFAESKQYAFGFDVKYFDETKTYINLSGDARVDLVNDAYEITGLEIGGNELNLAYADGVVYVEYAGEKIKANVTTVMGLVKVLMPIVGAYVGGSDMGEMDYMALASEAFGQDVSTLTISDLVKLVTLNITGTLDDLGIEVYANTANAVKANVGVEFIGNELSAINLTLQDMASVELQVKEFEAISIADGEYYNLTSKHLGYAEVTYVDGEDEIAVAADVALGMGENVYLKLSSVVMGEVVEVVVLNGSAYVTVGDVVLAVGLTEVDGLIAEVMAILEMTKPVSVATAEEKKQEALTLKAVGELLKSIDLNAFNFK
ncbi:MAG: hypothetical protein IJW24_02645, partial [Clostridia bacterium]|nr:hypothetical protein [Clostridia bacterium]